MQHFNEIIAQNILNLLKKQKKKQAEMAKAIGLSPQAVCKILSCSRVLTAIEMQRIADFLGTTSDALFRTNPETGTNADVIGNLIEIVETDSARTALQAASEIAEMITFNEKAFEGYRRSFIPLEI